MRVVPSTAPAAGATPAAARINRAGRHRPVLPLPAVPVAWPLGATVLVALAAGLVPGDASPVLQHDFDAADGVFVAESDFWGSADRGASSNGSWFAESGTLRRVAGAAHTDADAFRMWSRRTDLSWSSVELDVRFEGWTGGDEDWHGVNLWLNRTVCTPVPTCSAVDDRGGNSGYALDFVNRDGRLTILKKVPGDTRNAWPEGAEDVAQGGTYYALAETTFTPEPGRAYRFGGRVLDRGDGTSATLQVLIDGEVVLDVVDDGRIGGPRLEGGRVGLRSDMAELSVDDLVVRRSPSGVAPLG